MCYLPHLQGVDGQEDACPPVTLFIDFFLSFHSFFSSQKNDNLKRTIHKRQTRNDKGTEHKQPPGKKKNIDTPAFQGSGSPPFPPGSNFLFSSLAVFLSLGLRLACRETAVDAVGGVVISLSARLPTAISLRGKVFPPNFELTPTAAGGSGSSSLPVREMLLSGCFKTRTSRW